MAKNRRDNHLKVTVAVLTQDRPAMLTELIKSWGDLELPENCTVRCLVVENDQSPKSRDVVLKHSPLPNSLPVEHVLETELGIAPARNRAAQEAISANSDLLAFLDDDEVVDPKWLVEIIKTYRQGTASLIGGPQEFFCEKENLTREEEQVWQTLVEENQRRNAECIARVQDGSMRRHDVYTNNWLNEVDLFSKHNIWFDVNLRYCSGEDSQFCEDIVARGFEIGWSPNAVVIETVPAKRLSYKYQYERGKNFFTPWLYRRLKSTGMPKHKLLARMIGQCAKCISLLVVIPFGDPSRRFEFARRTGWIAGCWGSFFGRQGNLYRKAVDN